MNELTKVWYLLSFSFGCWTCLNCLLNRNLARPVKWSILAFSDCCCYHRSMPM